MLVSQKSDTSTSLTKHWWWYWGKKTIQQLSADLINPSESVKYMHFLIYSCH